METVKRKPGRPLGYVASAETRALQSRQTQRYWDELPEHEKRARRDCRRKIDHERVLNLWAQGHSTGLIAVATSVNRNSVRYVVCEARKRGDSRAVLRQAPPNFVRTPGATAA